jgi:hypothetical protein
LAEGKRQIDKRLDKTKLGMPCPVLSASNIHYEISSRQRAISAGGIGAIHQMVKWLGLDSSINESISVLKFRMPYAESDHILNIAYNLLAGGTCLEHLELRRQDIGYLNALGARRIADPTTAGDFCRRFTGWHALGLMEVINETRLKVWARQPHTFFEEAQIDADGTMVETYGECKGGMDINHKEQWGYHPLVVSLANTGELLYIVNRSGNRPSHEQAAFYLDQSVRLCQRAGFHRIRLRGDTDFTQTEHLDSWDEGGVSFVFGIDAMANLYERAENLPRDAWKRLKLTPCRRSCSRPALPIHTFETRGVSPPRTSLAHFRRERPGVIASSYRRSGRRKEVGTFRQRCTKRPLAALASSPGRGGDPGVNAPLV